MQKSDGWMDVVIIYRRSTPKGHTAIQRLNDFIKIPFYIMNLFGKRLEIFNIDRISKTIGMTIKT